MRPVGLAGKPTEFSVTVGFLVANIAYATAVAAPEGIVTSYGAIAVAIFQ